jgi:prevent-host-death family protein
VSPSLRRKHNLTRFSGPFCHTVKMTVKMSMHEAKARLSHVVAMAESGECVELTRHGKVVAIVTGAASARRKPGSGVGTVVFNGAFELTDSEIDDMFHRDLPA